VIITKLQVAPVEPSEIWAVTLYFKLVRLVSQVSK